MQIKNITNLPVYLPLDISPVPFGDVIEGITCTSAAPGVITAVGYAPVLNDAVSFSFLAGGSIPTGLIAGQLYFVVSPVNNTFSVSLTKGGGAITTSSTGASLVLHLLSGETDGTTLPFKPGNTVAVFNMTAGPLTLQGSPDTNSAAVGAPSGPSGFVTLATIPATSVALVNLSTDWIRVSTAATLVLVQN